MSVVLNNFMNSLLVTN